MLDSRVAQFHSLVWKAVLSVGRNAPRITDRVLGQAFPRTQQEAIHEGADKMFRTGVLTEVRTILKGGDEDEDAEGQADFSDVEETFRPIVLKLNCRALFVEVREEFIPIDDLIEQCLTRANDEPDWLEDAWRYLRRKSLETYRQSRTAEELWLAVRGQRQRED